ncbi:MAG: CRISPR-associated helicase/endonuclease Cas3 [Nitrospinae bacterium CG11_big_fil_rev_8_21_14_0_20_56_8]|nr:MAG: CRISPR-associated helicase/endonuclease Cas3 [Nitrospinae bacterium CG11_big_fil_rev_8_21_14_0_20_56_8]
MLHKKDVNRVVTLLAHVRKDEAGNYHEHSLVDHLQGVKKLAGQFAENFGNSDWAGLAGLWHDLGKYSKEFQTYIKSASGYDPEAHIENRTGRVDHSTAGALHAIDQLGPHGRILAYIIAGHHAGLPDWFSSETGRKSLSHRLENNDLLQKALSQSPPQSVLNETRPNSRPPGGSMALWIRMLFSCLVDADFLDTEEFMDPDRAENRSSNLPLADLLSRFNEHMKRFESYKESTPLNRIRNNILHQCITKSALPPGLFSLTVPTGGGKTLSSMAFALNHALHFKKNRIIYVIPFTSIIEQTANIFREIFGETVIEHHSNLEFERETAKNRLACENWDAPIIITTTVQFFESLFAAKTSRARKLHNIINSIVILDEAQLLPADFLEPITRTIQELSDFYQTTFLLSTATQPALAEQKGFGRAFKGLKNVREIMENPLDLYQALKRVEINFPGDFFKTESWEEIAGKLKKHPTVLCIVNRRTDCRELFRLMPQGTYHLSALMCGEHRSQVIREIKHNLEIGEPVRVISTQLVEAGVDLDFPVVYRAMAGLDSIAQAAGRCNREEKLEFGEFVIFVPSTVSPPGMLRKGEDSCRMLLKGGLQDPLSPEAFHRYFTELYWKMNSLDKHKILDLLTRDERQMKIQFRTAAENFRIIDDRHHRPVIVRFNNNDSTLELLKTKGPERFILRKLQRYIVTIPLPLHQSLANSGAIEEIHPGIFVQTYPQLYHKKMGFMGGDEGYQDPEDYVI